MSLQRKSLVKGIVLLVSFAVVLVLLFLPLINGHNTLEFLDNLYNSISKGSANYLPNVQESVRQFPPREIDVVLTLADDRQAAHTAQMIAGAGARAQAEGNQVKVKGDLAGILSGAIADAEKMYANQGEAIKKKYEFDERRALYTWWNVLKAMDFELGKQKLFKEAKLVTLVQNRAVEMAFNYFGIEAQSVRDKYAIVIASLIFYVVYTLWYGFGVMYLFEGLGLKLGH